ncbi:uncharacterized protein LOC144167134 [Haemaphysalis longicornis]
MKMIAKLLVAGMVATSVTAEGGFGFQRGGFRGGRLLGAAATPGYAAADGPPQPYSFGYDNTDEFGTQLFHNEQGDANNAKTGSYGYRDANGIYRTVSYVADANGFRATIDTNEPGTAPGQSADAVFNAKPVAAPTVRGAASAPIGAAYARPGAGGSFGGFGGGQFGARGHHGSWSG